MTFFDLYKKYEHFDFDTFIKNIKPSDFDISLNKEYKNIFDFLTLIAFDIDNATLEIMATKSQETTLKNFGKTISLYSPLYLANYCVNNCLYCGFKASNKIRRKKLTIDDLKKEAIEIQNLGIKHVLILTGESRHDSSVEYILECLNTIKPYFSSISIEIYPLESDEYKLLIDNGVDGLTIYQETYRQDVYKNLHTGPKKDFVYRLETPDRAASSHIRTIGVGALLGLYDVYYDAFFTALHAYYLIKTYPDIEVSVSFPRIRPEVGGFEPHTVVDDRLFVRLITAMRLFLPKVGILLSTRESASFRDNIMGLGVTKFSAGSKTEVGGYTLDDKTERQFDISDERTVSEIADVIYKKGYQPIYTDWVHGGATAFK